MGKLEEKEIRAFKQHFVKLVLDEKADSENSIARYSVKTTVGMEIYDNFSDEELLELLREKAKILNHSPSQKEVSPIFREYIRLRFKRWPYALKKANLSKAAGSGGETFSQMEVHSKQPIEKNK